MVRLASDLGKRHVQGSGGQSFGCFLVNGINLRLTGEANDYVGKSMAGGEIVIVPPPASTLAPHVTSLVGNTCLYGATGGRLFVHGRAGGLRQNAWKLLVAALLQNAQMMGCIIAPACLLELGVPIGVHGLQSCRVSP